MLVCPCKDDADLVKPGGGLPASAVIHVFENQNHGFFTQGDPAVPAVQADVELGLQLVQAMFSPGM